jgi:hypothetical protein
MVGSRPAKMGEGAPARIDERCSSFSHLRPHAEEDEEAAASRTASLVA